MRVPVLICLFAAAPAAAADWTLESVAEVARPSAERLAAESFLATTARELSLSRGVLLQGAELTAEAGRRRSPEAPEAPEGTSSDFALGVELPLAGDRAERDAVRGLFAESETVLPAAADLEAGLALQLAYVNAWEAMQGLALARRQAAASENWREIVDARVVSGAEAPFETSLVVAEVALSRLALGEARERVQLAWSELEARASVGPAPAELAEARPVAPSGPQASRPGIETSLLLRAIELRSALTRALGGLEAARGTSRWSLLASAAQEGEEDVARVGVGYRMPLAGENAARASAREAAFAAVGREAELERSRLAGRLRGAVELAATLSESEPLSAPELESALTALEVRVTTGRDSPSEVLPLRRQLIGALLTELSARAARARAAFQIQTLTAETSR